MLSTWLLRDSPGLKRKADDIDSDDMIDSSNKKSFKKSNYQNNFSWYKQDADKKWHCEVCRGAKLDNAYARGHDQPAKTTNHQRHGLCKYLLKQ